MVVLPMMIQLKSRLGASRTMSYEALLLSVILALSIGTSRAVDNTTDSTQDSTTDLPTVLTTEISRTRSTALTTTTTISPNVVKGPYYPPTDLRANITSGIVNVMWKPPPKEKSPAKPMYEIWLAYKNATSPNLSNFTKIDATMTLVSKFNLKKILHLIVNNKKLEQRVVKLVFKVRTVNSNKKDRTKGKFSEPTGLKLKPQLNDDPYTPPMNIMARLTQNGTVYLNWTQPANCRCQPPEKPLYDIQIAYGTDPGVPPSTFLEFQRMTATYFDEDIGKILRQLVDDSEDKLVSYLLFQVRAIKIVAKNLIYGNFSEIIKVKIRASQPRNFTLPKKPKTWIYIVAPLGGVAVALVIILGVYCHKQYRIRKSYMSYIRTQYDTESEALSVSNENFGLDPDNQPQIRFSDGEGDDESLIVA